MKFRNVYIVWVLRTAQVGKTNNFTISDHKEHLKIEPALAEACEGSYTSFKCTFDSMLESIFMWKKDGQVDYFIINL